MKTISIFLFLLVLGLACNNNSFKIDDSGLEYKFIVENKTNIYPQIGDIITLKLRYTDADNKPIEESAIFKTPLKNASHKGGSIENALAIMRKGDSAIFRINAWDYYTKTRKIQVPENFKPEDKLIFYIRVMDVKPLSEFEEENKIDKLSDEREEEVLLNDYLSINNIQVEPSLSGLYFIEIKKGNGSSPIPGKKVKVHYKGYFIDGKVFDSSYDRNEPFEYDYGIGQVIQGWDEGVSKMVEGGKYKLIIPSYLAYGNIRRGPIPPNSTLIFEMELLYVEK